MFSNKIASSLKGSTLAACPVHVILLNFSNALKRWLVQLGHILVAFLSIQCFAEQQGGKIKLTKLKKDLNGYFSSALVERQDCIFVTSFADGRELK